MATDVVEATISEIKAACRDMRNTDKSKKLAVNLSGPPGVGKTDLFAQLAEEWNADYRVFLTSTMDPTDLVGIPHNIDNAYTAFLPPKEFLALTTECEKVGVNPNKSIVATFEDLPACHPQVFNALLRFIQQREVAGKKIRDNVFLCATGNRVEDRAGAASIPTALANRFIHFNMKIDINEWCSWAILEGIDPLLISYVERTGPLALHNFDSSSGFLAFPTPRSVVMGDSVMKAIGHNKEKDLHLALSGCCGSGWATAFMAFQRIREKIIPITEIFRNPTTAPVPSPTDIDLMFITTNNCISSIMSTYDVNQVLAFLTYLVRYDSEECILHGAKKILKNIIWSSKFEAKDQMRVSTCSAWTEITKMQHLIKNAE